MASKVGELKSIDDCIYSQMTLVNYLMEVEFENFCQAEGGEDINAKENARKNRESLKDIYESLHLVERKVAKLMQEKVTQ